MTALPLLKFDKNEKGTLAQEGLDAIKRLPDGGLLCPVIFIGDGRGGKSYLASRLAGDESAFVSSDTAEPVTEGIDIVLQPTAPLLKACGLPEGARDEYLLVLDCEGGNNAMAAIRTLVNVFGIVIGTQVVFVASGMASEQALQNLGASLAATSLIKLDDGAKLPDRHLHFVVNKNTLKYGDDAFETMLDFKDGTDEARREVRESIRDSFGQRSFHVVPMKGMPNFEDSVTALRKAIMAGRKPFNFGDTPVTGTSMAGLLDLIVKEIRKSNEVSFPSMHRYVILDGFLLPTAESLAKKYEESLPELDDYDADLENKNPKSKILDEFSKTVSYIKQEALITEARQALLDKMHVSWDAVVRCNNAYGDQVKGEVQTETREVAADQNLGPIGGRGLLRKVEVTMQRMRVESRAVIHRKRGGEPELGPWMDTGSTTTRILESAFESYGQLPVLRGKLHKKSPNILRLVMKKQERSCILKDGHFLWWNAEKMQQRGEASGCINFLIHRAQVIKDEGAGTFIIKPADESGWSNVSSFSGGEQREFTFDASECETNVHEWVRAIKQHIEFAGLAYKQLGEDKILEQVGIYKPTVSQIDG